MRDKTISITFALCLVVLIVTIFSGVVGWFSTGFASCDKVDGVEEKQKMIEKQQDILRVEMRSGFDRIAVEQREQRKEMRAGFDQVMGRDR